MYVRNLFNTMEYFYIAVFLQLDALLAYYRFDTLTLTLVLSSSLNPFIHFFFSIITSFSAPLRLLSPFSHSPLSASFPAHFTLRSSPLHTSFTSLSTSPLHPPHPLSPLSQVRSVGASLISPRRRREVSNDRH